MPRVAPPTPEARHSTMNKYDFVLTLITIIMTGTTAMVAVASYFTYRTKRLKYDTRPVDLQLEQRLSRIETAVESIATEVERISEGQRFTSKLLVERQGAPAPLAPGDQASQWEGRTHAG